MFDKVKQGKQLLKMRSEAKKIQTELEKITHSEDNGEYLVKVNGAQNVVYIEKDGEELPELARLINNAMKGVQKKSAQKMMEMGGGLSSLFGN